MLEGRRRLEQKRLEAAELAAEAEVRRNRDALALAEAEREARAEEARLVADRKRLELDHLRWQQQAERDAAEADARRLEREREEELCAREEARILEAATERWRNDWLEWSATWAIEHVGTRYAGAARRPTLDALAGWTVRSSSARILGDLRVALEHHFRTELKERRDREWARDRETLVTRLTEGSQYRKYGRRKIEAAARTAIATLDPRSPATMRIAKNAIDEAGFQALLDLIEALKPRS